MVLNAPKTVLTDLTRGEAAWYNQGVPAVCGGGVTVMRAYHFLKDNMTGGYGNEPAWVEGEERTVEGELKMCAWGYHASPSWYDALSYARGNMACLVELSGEIMKDTDKYVARSRKLIKARSAEKVLRAWACDCAEKALKETAIKDERSWNALRVARLYNEGKATGVELGDAAWAAWDAVRVTGDAARATGDAARAAWDTARAAWDAAWAAEYAVRAAGYAVRAAEYAVRAAGYAVRAAGESWQKQHLDKLMSELFEEVS